MEDNKGSNAVRNMVALKLLDRNGISRCTYNGQNYIINIKDKKIK